MQTSQLIDMLNRDLADEHAATLRYLVHSYFEGEDNEFGAPLLSRAREEMWHMHWLGMIIGNLGGEPELVPAEYPYDSSNRGSILKSYIEYEENLVPHYNKEAEKVDDPHIKRVLEREAWESSNHAQKFRRMLDKMSTEEAKALPDAETELPQEFLNTLQKEVAGKYTQILAHIRDSWVFQKQGTMGWRLMDQAMEMMKQLAHFTEDVAENGVYPQLEVQGIERKNDPKDALSNKEATLQNGLDRHGELQEQDETKKHKGFLLNLDLTIRQEAFQLAELQNMRRNM